MQARLRKLCNELEDKGSGLSFDTCKQLLLDSVNLYPKTTLVLDALDECNPELRSRLIATLEDLLSNAERPLKIFISSRPYTDIRDCYFSRPNVEIQARDNRDDIKTFLDERVRKKEWPESLLGEIKETLWRRSEGM